MQAHQVADESKEPKNQRTRVTQFYGPNALWPHTCRFTQVADESRERRNQQLPRPMEGQLDMPARARNICVHALIVMLVVPARACTICVIGGGVQPPRGMSVGVPIVAEEWLLHVAETHTNPDPKLFPA
eukprot:gene9912-7779_t